MLLQFHQSIWVRRIQYYNLIIDKLINDLDLGFYLQLYIVARNERMVIYF